MSVDISRHAVRDPRLRLVCLSFLMLFVELALIRWLGENVVYLSYFTNFVLLGSFLGIGLGFLLPHKPGGLRWFPAALFALVALILVFPVEIDRSGSDVIFFGRLDLSGLPIWVMLPLVFAAVVIVLFLIGQAVAREFAKFRPLIAYRLDITGSVLGVVGFAGLAWLKTPPVVWAMAVLILFVLLSGDEMHPRGMALMVGVVIVLGAQSFLPGHLWSPYYKVQTVPVASGESLAVTVNGIPHQTITTVARREAVEPVYFLPYQLASVDFDRVMIIGAGTGTDVAIALHHGVEHVDAVEIDPTLYDIGVDRHPNSPYSDPRVTVIIDDGRAWMERSPGDYDLILFALPDSLTLVSSQSNLRLESFLFTHEAIDKARELLSPTGVFAMYNYYREDWLIDRLAATIDASFGSDRCVVTPESEGRLALLAGGPGVAASCPAGERDVSSAPPPVTDDYPFLYVRTKGIPAFYLAAMASVLIVSMAAIRIAGTRLRSIGPNLDLFLMGAAFLLLETKSVVQFALWFGTTWRVNALVFVGVLLSVLAAIEVARLGRLPRPAVLYGVLVAAIIAAWAVPSNALLDFSAPTRFVVAVLLTFTPIFIANLVFAQRFANVEDSTTAFGINLLGAMVGGVLEYTSLLVGYRALAVLVGVIYVGAYLAWRASTSGPMTEGRALTRFGAARTREVSPTAAD